MPEERQTLPKMRDKTISFVTKALEYATLNPTFVPPYLNTAELTKDVNLAEQHLAVNNSVQILAEKVNDTLMAARFEAFATARTFTFSKNCCKTECTRFRCNSR